MRATTVLVMVQAVLMLCRVTGKLARLVHLAYLAVTTVAHLHRVRVGIACIGTIAIAVIAH